MCFRHFSIFQIVCHLKHKVSTVSTLCFNTDVVILCFNFFVWPQTGSWHQLVEFKNAYAYQLWGTALAAPHFRWWSQSHLKQRFSQIPRRSTQQLRDRQFGKWGVSKSHKRIPEGTRGSKWQKLMLSGSTLIENPDEGNFWGFIRILSVRPDPS